MMFLFYASLGSWNVTAGTFLLKSPDDGGMGFTTQQVGWIYSTVALGALFATPLVGLLVDRLFRAEIVFAIACIACGFLLVAAGSWCETSRPLLIGAFAEAGKDFDSPLMRAAATESFRTLFVIMLVQAFCLQIALTLCTVLSLRNLPDPSHQFSRTRLFGTLGWVVVCNLIGFFMLPISPAPFYLAGGIAILAGLYAFTLPATHPKGTGKGLGEAFGLPAFKLFRDRSFCTFILVALLNAQMNQFYGVYGHRCLTDRHIGTAERWMTLGQVVEVGCMFAIPLLNPKSNMKWLMLLGAGGGAVRSIAMMAGPDWLALGLGVPMHGWSYAFYYIVAASFIDREAPPHLRASAQAIAAFVSSGLGPWTGNMIAATAIDRYQTENIIDWPSVWVVPLIGSSLATMIFAIGFRTPGGR
jgi:MFS family permease